MVIIASVVFENVTFFCFSAKENYVQIGEGDFAQVYRSLRGKGDVVLKVMAACDDADPDAAWWIKGFSHYVPEVIASQ